MDKTKLNTVEELKKDLLRLKNPEKAKTLAKFFKTGKGEYGEGDIFLGIIVPKQREVAIRYKELNLNELQKLLNSKIHEERLVALLILVEKYNKADERCKKQIVDLYLKNTKNINNWDLVDLSAEKILGEYFLDKDKSVILKLAKSKSLWERRIGIITTFRFIKNKKYDVALKISEMLLSDKHDLIHKAVGWMLREIGKRDQKVEENFLKNHYKKMPRTMLRYAIEKFKEKKRRIYLKRF